MREHSFRTDDFPGVGEASTAMHYLRERGLDAVISKLTQPVLGICLGMQLMCRYSEENDTPCLGIFDEKVKLFQNNVSSDRSTKSEIEKSAEDFSPESRKEIIQYVEDGYLKDLNDTENKEMINEVLKTIM